MGLGMQVRVRAYTSLLNMGFEKEVLQESDGAQVQAGQTVTVHCTGTVVESGYQFWSTKDAGQKPFSFTIGQGSVIPAWDEGVLTMNVGEVSIIHATSDYAYGANGFPAWKIPPNADLDFEIEVISSE